MPSDELLLSVEDITADFLGKLFAFSASKEGDTSPEDINYIVLKLFPRIVAIYLATFTEQDSIEETIAALKEQIDLYTKKAYTYSNVRFIG